MSTHLLKPLEVGNLSISLLISIKLGVISNYANSASLLSIYQLIRENHIRTQILKPYSKYLKFKRKKRMQIHLDQMIHKITLK